MSTPIGHALAGVTIARRFGVRSRLGLAAAVVAAGLPDTDVFIGLALHRDPWKLHRKTTHTMPFAMTAGAVAGALGLISAGNAGGHRDLVADALVGATLVGSHVAMDRLPFPYLKAKKAPLRRALAFSAANWTLDALVWGFVASKLWRRD